MRAPYLDDGDVRLYLGDCLDVLAEMEPESVDAVVCDPPYGLEFMGKDWDAPWKAGAVIRNPATERGGFQDGNGGNPYSRSRIEYGFGGDSSRYFAAWCESWAREALRVLKPGGHLLAFGGTRTFHRLTCGIEDAGFEIRDCLSYLYGSGFPKSLDVSKAIDKKRYDRDEIYEVTAWIRAARDAAGIGNKDIDNAFGFAGMAGHWTTSKSQPAVPTLDQVDPLLRVLGVAPEDVPPRIAHLLWELNGRKGQPGKAWFQREVVGRGRSAIANKAEGPRHTVGASKAVEFDLTAPATDAASEWQGWGTALKPGHEPAVVARKPHTPQTELAAEAARAEEELCAVVSYAATVTSWSELLRESGISSIASWLRACLVDLSTRASTFTTETASSLTTDLAIWRSSLSPITLASITRAPTPEPGMSSAANAAAVLSRSVLLKCERLTATTAGETAIARPAVPGLTQASGLDNPAPAWEPCVVARKPLAGTVAENVQAHGTGALNIDGCRIGTTVETWPASRNYAPGRFEPGGKGTTVATGAAPAGRWPANVALDDQAAAMLDAQSGSLRPATSRTDRGDRSPFSSGTAATEPSAVYEDGGGGASRFYYTAKASRSDRTSGGIANNTHPTVKPTDLMRWLVRLVTPPGGLVLDPFAGSGSTLVAARAEGFRAIGIEREEEYAAIIADRLSQLSLFSEAL